MLEAVVALQGAVDDVLARLDCGALAELGDEDLVEVVQELEAARRCLETSDHAVVREVGSRDLADRTLSRNPAGFLAQVCRLTPGAARARVREAEALGERRALTGEPLEPVRPQIAAARRLGLLDAAQVRVMLRAFRELPPGLPVEDLAASETILLDAARALHAGDLARVASALVDAACPDGPEPEETVPDPRRHLTLTRRHDSWGRLGGLLDPETTAMLDAWLGVRARPRPADDTGRDARSAEQRRHDALGELLSLALRADECTATTGAPVTLHVTMTAEQFETGTGHAVTGLGQKIRVSTALRMAGQCRIAWLVHTSRGGILRYGRTRRLATRDQADALLARDRGCAFPGCDQPPQWCERHHVRPWVDGGPTDVDNMILLCRYHHARFTRHGWQITMHQGVPWFTPPAHVDPDRTPIRSRRSLTANPLRAETLAGPAPPGCRPIGRQRDSRTARSWACRR